MIKMIHSKQSISFCTLLLKLILICLICIASPFLQNASGQDLTIEETEDQLKNTYGLKKLKALNRLSKYYQHENLRKAIKYGKQAVSIGEDIFVETNTNVDLNESYRLAKAYFLLGEAHFLKENYFESQENLLAAKILSDQINYGVHLKKIEEYLGEIQAMIEAGEIKENFFSKNFGDIKVGEAFNDASKDIKIQTELIAARSNEKKGEFTDAIDHYEKAINLLHDKGDAARINELQLKIAFLLDSLDQHVEAQEFLSEAIKEIEASMDSALVTIAMDTLTQLADLEVNAPSIEIQESLRAEQKNLKDIAEKYAKEKDFEKSLAYYKLYQELSQKMITDSLALIAENIQRKNEMLLLNQQKIKADQKVQTLELEKEKQVRLRNTAFVFIFLILISALVTLYFYINKRRDHKKLSIAYRDLDNTKNKLVGAEKKIVKLLNQQLSGDVVKQLLTGNTDKPGESDFLFASCFWISVISHRWLKKWIPKISSLIKTIFLGL